MKPLWLNETTKLSFPIKAKIGISLIFAFLFVGNLRSQSHISKPFYVEINVAARSSFGPSENQAEISGGVDTLSFDHKKHLIPGFKSALAPELVIGYRKDNLHFESTISWFSQDIGLIHKLFNIEYPFAVSEMVSIKLNTLLQFCDRQKNGEYGLYMGVFVEPVFSVSNKLNKQTRTEFSVGFRPSVQMNWGVDYKYLFRIGKKGAYLSTGASVTMPGIIGSIGKIDALPGSSYSIVRDKVQMFTIKGSIGIGFGLGKINKR